MEDINTNINPIPIQEEEVVEDKPNFFIPFLIIPLITFRLLKTVAQGLELMFESFEITISRFVKSRYYEMNFLTFKETQEAMIGRIVNVLMLKKRYGVRTGIEDLGLSEYHSRELMKKLVLYGILEEKAENENMARKVIVQDKNELVRRLVGAEEIEKFRTKYYSNG